MYASVQTVNKLLLALVKKTYYFKTNTRVSSDSNRISSDECGYPELDGDFKEDRSLDRLAMKTAMRYTELYPSTNLTLSAITNLL